MRRRGGLGAAVVVVMVALLALLPGGALARDPEPLPTVSHVSVGTDHTCATWWNGVSCWGDNDDGMLGNGTASGSLAAPIAPPMIEPQSVVSPHASSSARPFAIVDAGPRTTCAIGTGQGGTIEGSVWCWGGQPLGRICVGGDLGAASDPGMVMAGPVDQDALTVECGTPLASVIRVAVGQGSGCALVRSDPVAMGGDPWCWGMGDQNAILAHPLGTDGTASPGSLVELDGALDRFCALATDGAVWCWTGAEGTPSLVTGLAPAVAIAVGDDHACAQVEDGSVWCWGANDVGQLGDGTTTASEAPVQVVGLESTGPAPVGPSDMLPDGTRVLAAGTGLTCVLRGQAADDPRAAAGAWCWGANNRGQLGDGSRDRRTGPVQVTGLASASGLVEIAAGGSSACVVTIEEARTRGTDPTLGGFIGNQASRCWGANERGQLGVGDWEDRTRPTLVVMTEEPRFRD